MFKHLAAAALLLLPATLLPGSALGDIASGSSCSKIDDEAHRLICYDLVFRVGSTSMGGGDSLPMLPDSVPNWPMTTGPSKLSKGTTVTIATVSSRPINEDEQLARMSVGCDSDRTSVTFNFTGYFIAGANGGNVIKAKVDNGKTMEVETIASESVIVLFGGNKSVPFLKSLLTGKSLHLIVQPTSGPPVETEFKLDGLGQAIAPIQQACHWA